MKWERNKIDMSGLKDVLENLKEGVKSIEGIFQQKRKELETLKKTRKKNG